jgi:predicted phosphodiesterase
LFVDGRTWFAAHGHRAGANPTAGDLPKLPAGSVVLTGHTHIPTLDTTPEGVLLLNPGSTSIPKGGFAPSYAVYEDGRFAVVSLDGEVILTEDKT